MSTDEQRTAQDLRAKGLTLPQIAVELHVSLASLRSMFGTFA